MKVNVSTEKQSIFNEFTQKVQVDQTLPHSSIVYMDHPKD